ncbi:AraC family transcriptional regulator [Sediminibacterium roseum]|uniref:AraC family transcriptional regulator n=1 Tax=Sediminibacterium roseum TaxID=1978412 RepID=A0ABW9ZVR8_9BACT|nr:AraC family transcriptional regulator [Sediminibacterium roseum]NCI50113.1 AraC family transcriptional regulator [Sediminibacterium roseum]
MKVLQFTLPVPGDNNIIIKRDVLPYFYQHLHRHDEIQITWIQKGEGTLVVNNNMHVFGPNEIYFIGANQPHVFKSDPVYFDAKSKRNVKALSIHFNPQGKLRPFLELAEMKPMLAFLKKHNNGFSIPEEHVPDVAHKMELVLKHKNMDQLVSLIDLFKKFASIPKLKELSSIYNHSEVSEHDGIRLSNIYHYIMANYARSITLEDVAQQAFMTPQAFCRYFKKRTLHTFVSFLNEVRINEACKKLTAGDAESVSISAIAYNSGFNTVTNFNRVFKTIVGKSPSEYQEDYFRSAYEETTV